MRLFPRCVALIAVLLIAPVTVSASSTGAATDEGQIVRANIFSHTGMAAFAPVMTRNLARQESVSIDEDVNEVQSGSCGAPADGLPQDFNSILSSLSCTYPSQGVRSQQFCDCVKRLSGALSMRERSKSGDFENKVAQSSQKLTALANAHYLRRWTSEFRARQRSIGALQRRLEQSSKEAPSNSAVVTLYCHPGVFAASFEAMQSDSSCDPQQLGAFKQALVEELGEGKRSGASAAEIFRTATGDGLHSRSSRNHCLTSHEAHILRLIPMARGQRDEFNRSVLSDVEQVLAKTIRELEAGQAKFLADPLAFDLNRQSEQNWQLAEVLKTVPSAQAVFLSLSRPGKYDLGQHIPRALSEQEKATNYQALLGYLRKVHGLYRDISATVKTGAGQGVRPRLLRAFAEFNKSTEDQLLQAATVGDLYSYATSQCQGMVRDLRKIACAKPLTNNLTLLNSLLARPAGADHRPLVSSAECNQNDRASTGNPETKENCILMGEALCRSGGEDRESMEFEVLGDSERVNPAFGQWDADRRAQVKQVQQEYCGQLADWAQRPTGPCGGRQGSELMFCLQNRQTHQSFASHFPESEIAQYFRESFVINAETRGGLENVLHEESPKSRYKNFSDVAQAFRSASDVLAGLDGASGLPTGDFIASFSTAAASFSGVPAIATPLAAAGASLPVISPPEIRRRVAEKSEEISAKDEELAGLSQELARAETPEQRSTVSAQIAQLQSELAQLRSERAGLEAQLQRATTEAATGEEKDAKGPVASGRRARAPASGAGEVDVAQAAGFSTGAASSGSSPVAAPAASGTNASVSTGPGLGAARAAATVKELNELPVSGERALSVQGTSVPTGNVLSLQVPSLADLKAVELLISSQRERLRFNEEGWATVELIDQATQQVLYMKVRLDDQKLVVERLPAPEQQGIQRQVRAWAASYQNLLKNLRDPGTRAPAAGPSPAHP